MELPVPEFHKEFQPPPAHQLVLDTSSKKPNSKRSQHEHEGRAGGKYARTSTITAAKYDGSYLPVF